MRRVGGMVPWLALLVAAACEGGPTEVVDPGVYVVDVDPPTAVLQVGDTIRLTATPRTATGEAVTGLAVVWTSEHAGRAAVAAEGTRGRVIALEPGEVAVTALIGGKVGRAELEIVSRVGPVATVDIEVASLELSEGGTATLAATARDAEGRVVTGRYVSWTSTDVEVLAVDGGGGAVGIRSGAVTIRARVDGVTDSIPALVTADYPYDLVFTGSDGVNPSSPRNYRSDLGDPTRAAVRIGPDAPSAGGVPSPDGQRLAYLLLMDFGSRRLMVANRDGTGATEIVFSTDTSCGRFTWSPDSGKIAFACAIGDADRDIWVVDADGSNLTNVTDAHPGRQEWPSWSPDLGGGASRIAYAQFVAGEPQIWSMNPDGSDPRQVTGGLDHQPAWSPDGTTIAFQRTGAAIFGDIWLADASGGNERGLVGAYLAGPQEAPAWSPDGRLVAFSSTHETYGSGQALTYHIYTVWADGSKLARRTTGDLFTSRPSWRLR